MKFETWKCGVSYRMCVASGGGGLHLRAVLRNWRVQRPQPDLYAHGLPYVVDACLESQLMSDVQQRVGAPGALW